MSLEKTALSYASVAGRLQGLISVIVQYSSDEISPRIKELLEKELKEAEELIAESKKDDL